MPADRSRTYTLRAVGDTPGTRLWATDSNATTDPFADTAGATLAPSAAAPEPALISSVGPFGSVRANTSVCWLASPATRLLASDSNATTDPSAEIDGFREPASPWALPPARPGVAIVVVPATVSRTKIWATPGPGSKLGNTTPTYATERPSPDTDGAVALQSSVPSVFSEATLVAPVARCQSRIRGPGQGRTSRPLAGGM